MGMIIYMMGKSSTGKDTIYKKLLQNDRLKLKAVILYTTRPRRIKETDGVEYHFVDEQAYEALKKQGKIIEERAYETFHGLWRYFTVDDGKLNLEKENYLIIGTLESYQKTKEYFGEKYMLPVMVETDDAERLLRAIKREKKQEKPKYEELCRRFLADSEDFSEEKIEKAGIGRRFLNNNDDLDHCLNEIENYILERCIIN